MNDGIILLIYIAIVVSVGVYLFLKGIRRRKIFEDAFEVNQE